MNILLVCLLATAFTALELFKGGARIAYALPCYALLAGTACLSIFHSQRAAISSSFRGCLAVSVAFFGYVLGRTLFSPDPYLARADFFLIGAVLIVYLLCAFHFTSSQLRLSLVGLFLTLAVVNFGVGAIQFFRGQNYMLFNFLPRTDFGTRVSGLYGNPNHLAGFLEVTFLFGLAATFWSRWPVYGKIICGYATLTSLVGLVLTGSRGGYVSLFFGSLVFAGFSLFATARTLHGRQWLIFAAMAVLALLIGIGVKEALAADYVLGERASMFLVKDVRLSLWRAAILQYHLDPWFGTGSGTYLFYGRLFRSPEVQSDPIYAHNDYLQLLAEYGLVGLLGLVALLIVHLRRGVQTILKVIKHCRRTGNHLDNSLALLLGALSSTVSLAVHSITDFNLHIPVNAVLMAFVFAILASQGRGLLENTEEPPGLWNRAVWLTLPALGLWMAIAAAPKIPAEILNEKSNLLYLTDQSTTPNEKAKKSDAYARQALQYDPANTASFCTLGQALFLRAALTSNSGERQIFLEDSASCYRIALGLSPQDRNIVLALIYSLNTLETSDEVEQLLRRALELDPNATDLHLAYGNFFEHRGRLDEADRQYKIAGQLSQNQAAAEGVQRIEKQKKDAATR